MSDSNSLLVDDRSLHANPITAKKRFRAAPKRFRRRISLSALLSLFFVGDGETTLLALGGLPQSVLASGGATRFSRS